MSQRRHVGTRRPRVLLSADPLEDRTVPAVYRSIDGTGNNQAHPDWGSTGVNLLRQAAAAYADGVSAPGGANRPSPRAISNAVVAEVEEVTSDRFLSAMVYAFGQFIDHDLDLTPNAGTETFNIRVPRGDPFFDPAGTGTRVIPFTRSMFDPDTGTSRNNPRQQPNVVTAWLDGSAVYGSDPVTAAKLRTFSGGRLKMGPDGLLPLNNAANFPTGVLPMANDAGRVPDDQLFAAGDVRANENAELTCIHTLFVREHNRLAGLIRQANPRMSDEAIYQRARALVGAQLQVITFREWLPTVLGAGAVRGYQGYKPNVNPGVTTEFSTAGFRVGHSMLGDDVEFLDNNSEEVRPEIPLSESFSNPNLLYDDGVSQIIKYLVTDPAREIDNVIVNSVRNFLFGPPGSGGFDLASLNIQRGRDHGLNDYNDTRAAYGLPRVTSFSQITSDRELQDELRLLYGSVDNIDLWVGGLAEDHAPGSSVGPLFRAIIADQFERVRDGDRFWYRREFDGGTLDWLESQTLSKVIARNTTTTNIQDNSFLFQLTISGTVFFDQDRDGRRDPGERGLEGRTVQLIDPETDEVIAEATTDGNGRYKFEVTDGLGPRASAVRQVLPTGWVQTTPIPDDVVFTRGGLSEVVNFGAARR